MARHVAAYPWEKLVRVSRRAERRARHLRDRIASVLPHGRLAAAIGEVLSAEVRLEPPRVAASDALPNPDAAVFLETADGSVFFAVEPEPALATLVLARVLGRGPALTAPAAPLDASTKGALAAVLVEMARRAGGTVSLRARREAPSVAAGARLDIGVRVDGRPFHLVAWASDDELPDVRAAAPSLAALGELSIRLPVVAAMSVAASSELAALERGDVWLPGEGWLSGPSAGTSPGAPLPSASFPRRLIARAALSPPDSERGVEVGCSDDGPLVLRGSIIALGADVTDTEAGRGGSDEAMSSPEETLTSLALDAPLVVRIEVGSVTLTARQWASLRAGDVLETGLRLAEPAVLRVAGREVARGDLVSVDGELGVRIRELTLDEHTG